MDFANHWFQGAGGYQIGNSLRFRGGQQRLTRTPTTNGNRKVWTCSGWVKKALVSPQGTFIGATPSGGGNTNYEFYRLTSPINVYQWGVGAAVFQKTSLSQHRDLSAWAHYVFVYDSAQANAVDRVRVYANGQQLSFTGSNPPQNRDSFFNSTSSEHFIGGWQIARRTITARSTL